MSNEQPNHPLNPNIGRRKFLGFLGGLAMPKPLLSLAPTTATTATAASAVSAGSGAIIFNTLENAISNCWSMNTARQLVDYLYGETGERNTVQAHKQIEYHQQMMMEHLSQIEEELTKFPPAESNALKEKLYPLLSKIKTETDAPELHEFITHLEEGLRNNNFSAAREHFRRICDDFKAITTDKPTSKNTTDQHISIPEETPLHIHPMLSSQQFRVSDGEKSHIIKLGSEHETRSFRKDFLKNKALNGWVVRGEAEKEKLQNYMNEKNR
jgi:hypothetical protein